MIGLLLLILAGACVAVMDTLQHHFAGSVFSKLNPNFWNAEISWKNKYVSGSVFSERKKWMGIPIPVIFTDGWHLFKGLHTVFFNCRDCITYHIAGIGKMVCKCDCLLLRL